MMDKSCQLELTDWLNPMRVEDLFPSTQPLEVDVGAGKGRFLLSRATRYPGVNFLGIDRMLRRIRRINRKAVRKGLANLRLLRADAYYTVTYLVPPASVSVIYVFFPDPWPKKKHAQNRLFNEAFMHALCRVLVPGGRIHFATDHMPYYQAVMDLLGADERLRQEDPFEPLPEERTDFELQFMDTRCIGRGSFARR